nr:RNA-dependent RNA polymerase [Pholiota nameko narnavirus 1]
MINQVDPFLDEIRRCCASLAREAKLAREVLRPRVKAAHLAVDSLYTCWKLCGWKLRPRNRGAVLLLCNLFAYVLKDPHMGLSDLKASLHHCRSQALTGEHIGNNTKGKVYPRCVTPSRKQLFQLSCASRSLPLPGKEVEEKALAKFRNTVFSPDPRNRAFYQYYQSGFFWNLRNMRIRDKFLRRWQQCGPEAMQPLGGASTAGFTRRQGGRSSAVSSVIGPSVSDLKWMSLSGPYGHVWYKMKKWEYSQKCPKPDVAVSEITVVKERGYKARIVTKNDPYRVARAHTIRQILYPLVTKNFHTCAGDLPMEIPLTIPKDGKERFIISVDIVAATDNIRHDFLDRLATYLDVEPELLHKNFEIDGQKILRGAFMGMPVSWTILELIHEYACRTVDRLGNYIHKGDDCLAYWTMHQFWEYLKVMRSFGLSHNGAKTFISVDAGTFCEGLYNLRDGVLHLAPTLSIRGMVSGTDEDRIGTMSQSSHEALRRGFDMTRFNIVRDHLFKREMVQLKKRHIDLYLPRPLGGAGLVPDKPGRLLSKYESGRYWGGLDKDLPGISPTIPSALIGPFTKELMKQLKKLKYRSGVEDPCPHLEKIFIRHWQRAALHDSGREVPRARIKKTAQILSDLCKIKEKIKPAYNAPEIAWAKADKVLTQATRKSIQLVFPHEECHLPEQIETSRENESV